MRAVLSQRCRGQSRKDRLCRYPVSKRSRREWHKLTLIVANNFWGKEDAGVQPLLERMQNAKNTCDELKAFYNSMNAWALILREYAPLILS